MAYGGVEIRIGRFTFRLSLWETYLTYEAEEEGGYVQIEEQRRKIIPKRRRIIHYKIGHDERAD